MQAQEAFQKLGLERNCVFGGDMNWNDRRDRKVPLPPGWFDPWNVLHPIEKVGFFLGEMKLRFLGSRRSQVNVCLATSLSTCPPFEHQKLFISQRVQPQYPSPTRSLVFACLRPWSMDCSAHPSNGGLLVFDGPFFSSFFGLLSVTKVQIVSFGYRTLFFRI
jgi:hypothetical protein